MEKTIKNQEVIKMSETELLALLGYDVEKFELNHISLNYDDKVVITIEIREFPISKGLLQ